MRLREVGLQLGFRTDPNYMLIHTKYLLSLIMACFGTDVVRFPDRTTRKKSGLFREPP